MVVVQRTRGNRHFPGIDSRLIPPYPCTEWSLVLSDLGMAVNLASSHTFRRQPSRKHLLKSNSQKVGKLLSSRFTMIPSMSSGPGHFLSSRFLMTSSTSCFEKFGSVWESGGPSSNVWALMFLCWALSWAVMSLGKKFVEESFSSLLYCCRYRSAWKG